MPWQLFEELYDAFALRQAIEDLMLVRNAMLAGMYANTNLDDTKERKDVRTNAVQKLYSAFEEQVEEMRNPTPEIDMDNPFFAAMRVPELDSGREAMAESYERVKQMPDIDIDQL